MIVDADSVQRMLKLGSRPHDGVVSKVIFDGAKWLVADTVAKQGIEPGRLHHPRRPRRLDALQPGRPLSPTSGVAKAVRGPHQQRDPYSGAQLARRSLPPWLPRSVRLARGRPLVLRRFFTSYNEDRGHRWTERSTGQRRHALIRSMKPVRVLDIGADPADEPDLRIRKRTAVFAALAFMAVGRRLRARGSGVRATRLLSPRAHPDRRVRDGPGVVSPEPSADATDRDYGGRRTGRPVHQPDPGRRTVVGRRRISSGSSSSRSLRCSSWAHEPGRWPLPAWWWSWRRASSSIRSSGPRRQNRRSPALVDGRRSDRPSRDRARPRGLHRRRARAAQRRSRTPCCSMSCPGRSPTG